MVADYQRAWLELGELIASKPGHGSRDLALAMTEILARHRVSESLLDQALRLHGGGVVIRLNEPSPSLAPASASTSASTSIPAAPPTEPEGIPSGSRHGDTGHSTAPTGGHDGQPDRRRPAHAP